MSQKYLSTLYHLYKNLQHKSAHLPEPNAPPLRRTVTPPAFPCRCDSRIARRPPRCKFAEFATYRNRHTAIISHAQRISRLPCKHIALCFRILFRGQSGVSNPFRGERDHREHTAKRCWKACPYDLHRFPTVGEGSPLPRLNKSKTVCIVILERSEGSADGFLHFLLSIIFYLFSII